MTATSRGGRAWAAVVTLLTAALWASAAHALPSFARQTGERCAACHVGGDWPQLTPWGRFFKLSGYTAGKMFVGREGLNHSPIGVFGQAGVTWAKAPDNSQGQPVIEPTSSLRGEQGVVYAGTRLSDFAGMFYEYQINNNFPGWTWSVGIADFRAVHFFNFGRNELLVGANMNNAPTAQDVFNTNPPWGYPFYGSPIAPGPPASTMLATLGNQVVGFGAYALFNREWYAEVSLYRVGNGFWTFMTRGDAFFSQPGGANYAAGVNPYWRLYWNPAWGPHNLMIGTYGLYSKVYPNNLQPSGPSDRFTDYYLDTQYQYLPNFVHKVTLRGYYYYERQNWDASFPLGLSSVANGRLTGWNVSGTYSYLDRYSFSGALFQSNGSNNAALYAVTNPMGNVISASPDTTGYVLQANWIPIQNLKVQLQYVGFTRFNGLSSNIDGMGRSPSDNNTLWLNVFLAI